MEKDTCSVLMILQAVKDKISPYRQCNFWGSNASGLCLLVLALLAGDFFNLKKERMGIKQLYCRLNFLTCKGRLWQTCTPALARLWGPMERELGLVLTIQQFCLFHSIILAVFADSKLRKCKNERPNSCLNTASPYPCKM